MTLLTELRHYFVPVFYSYAAPMALKTSGCDAEVYSLHSPVCNYGLSFSLENDILGLDSEK